MITPPPPLPLAARRWKNNFRNSPHDTNTISVEMNECVTSDTDEWNGMGTRNSRWMMNAKWWEYPWVKHYLWKYSTACYSICIHFGHPRFVNNANHVRPFREPLIERWNGKCSERNISGPKVSALSFVIEIYVSKSDLRAQPAAMRCYLWASFNNIRMNCSVVRVRSVTFVFIVIVVVVCRRCVSLVANTNIGRSAVVRSWSRSVATPNKYLQLRIH